MTPSEHHVRPTVPFALLALAAACAAAIQFKPAEIAQRPALEEFLASAEIVQSGQIGQGVTSPWKLTLEKDGIRRDAAWKDVDRRAMNRGERVLDSWKSEIAAYRLDKLVGLNLIPPCVEREFAPSASKKKRTGALSLWAENKMSYFKMQEKGIEFPPELRPGSDRLKFLVRFWDCLIANADRTQENILLTEDWRTILIDHSRAFQPAARYGRQLIFGVKGMQRLEDDRPILIRMIPRALYDRVLALDAKAIGDCVGPYLTKDQIDGIVARIPLLREEMEGMIKAEGEDKVLY
jgi:hypothetical protein